LKVRKYFTIYLLMKNINFLLFKGLDLKMVVDEAEQHFPRLPRTPGKNKFVFELMRSMAVYQQCIIEP